MYRCDWKWVVAVFSDCRKNYVGGGAFQAWWMSTFLGTFLSGSLSRPFVVLNAEDKLTRRVLLDHLSEDTTDIASIKATNDVTIEFFWTGQKTEGGDNAGSDKASGRPGRNEIGELWVDYFVVLTKNNFGASGYEFSSVPHWLR